MCLIAGRVSVFLIQSVKLMCYFFKGPFLDLLAVPLNQPFTRKIDHQRIPSSISPSPRRSVLILNATRLVAGSRPAQQSPTMLVF